MNAKDDTTEITELVVELTKYYGSDRTVPVLPVGISTAENGCKHIWKTYTGLKETFVYCERCDEKRTCLS